MAGGGRMSAPGGGVSSRGVPAPALRGVYPSMH